MSTDSDENEKGKKRPLTIPYGLLRADTVADIENIYMRQELEYSLFTMTRHAKRYLERQRETEIRTQRIHRQVEENLILEEDTAATTSYGSGDLVSTAKRKRLLLAGPSSSSSSEETSDDEIASAQEPRLLGSVSSVLYAMRKSLDVSVSDSTLYSRHAKPV